MRVMNPKVIREFDFTQEPHCGGRKQKRDMA
jgi:hypothetical protein